MLAAPVIQAIMVIMIPITYFFAVLKKISIKIFKVSGHHKITEDELMTMVEEAETDGGIDEKQSELIQNAIEFNDLVAIDVLTPRVDMEAIDIDMTNEEVDEIFRNTGFSRLPVYDDDLDEILGVLNHKDFHNYIYGKENSISDFVKPVAFVAGSMRLATLLRKLQQMKSHMAIIVDEYGGTEGLVTMEDIIEELVGEIYDEHDVVMSQQVTELQNGTYRVMCNANLANVFDYFGIEEEVDANTVNGWVVLCLDKLPEKGDTFEYTADFKRLKGRVTKANGKKAIEINLTVEVLPED
jgi:CBS domain containing-hemolysin-like protein